MDAPSYNELPVFHTEDAGDFGLVCSGLASPGHRQASRSSAGSPSEHVARELSDLLQGVQRLLEGQQRMEEMLSRQVGAHVSFRSELDPKVPADPSAFRRPGSRKGTLEFTVQATKSTKYGGSTVPLSQHYEVRTEIRQPANNLPEDMWDSVATDDSDEGDINASAAVTSTLSMNIFRRGNSSGSHQHVRDRSRCFVLAPLSPCRVAMDILSIAVLMYDLLSLPTQLAFDIPQEGPLLYMAMGSAFFWIADMLLRCRTGFFREHRLEMRPMRIFKHYLRTSFALDFSLVSLDIFALSLNFWAKSSNGTATLKIARIGKISRVARCMGFLRLRVMADIMDRLALRSKILHATSIVVYDIVRIIFSILWLNHIIACGWVALGRYVDSGTGVTWLHTPIGGGAPSEITYSACGHVYQYLTAFHWALTQMTPGSMQVFAVNSVERLFNIVGLIFGVLVFSTLISSISSTVAQFKLGMKMNNEKVDRLNKFLRKEGVSLLLSMKVRNQVKEKLGFQKPLVLKDIEVFEWLPLSTQIALRRELCTPHLTRHSLFGFLLAADEPTAEQFCQTCADFSVLGRGDTLFLAGTQATGTYLVASGSLSYSRGYRNSRSLETSSIEEQGPNVQKGDWISEAALWCTWRHVGSAEVPLKDACEILSVSTESFIKFLNGLQGPCGPVACAYARGFCALLNASFAGPRPDWATDTHLPFLVEEVIGGLPRQMKAFLGRVALRVLRKGIYRRRWLFSLGEGLPDMDKIKDEVCDGRGATLMLTSRSKLGVLRFSSMVALKLQRDDGKLMVAVRQEKEAGLAEAKLPGFSVGEEELPADTFDRLLSEYFGTMASHVYLDGVDREAPFVENTDELGVMTMRSRYVFNARWEPADPEEGSDEVGARGNGGRISERSELTALGSELTAARSEVLGESLETPAPDFRAAEMFLLPSGVLAAWFTQAELSRSNTEAGKGTLSKRLSGMSLPHLPRLHSKSAFSEGRLGAPVVNVQLPSHDEGAAPPAQPQFFA